MTIINYDYQILTSFQNFVGVSILVKHIVKLRFYLIKKCLFPMCPLIINISCKIRCYWEIVECFVQKKKKNYTKHKYLTSPLYIFLCK